MPARQFPEQEIADLLLGVYEIHDYLIEQTGGLAGLRDLALLHAAIARPFATYDGNDLYPDDFEKAAGLFHSLIKNHPFLDGTKRTAFVSALYFLEQYGHPTPSSLPMDQVIDFCLRAAEENMRITRGENVELLTINEIAEWFRNLVGVIR